MSPIRFAAPLLFASALALGPAALAQQASPEVVAPAQPAPPSPADVLGYELGEQFTDHAGILRYLDALAAASPQVVLRHYGTSVQDRPLLQIVIARAEHLARLPQILALNRELAEPDTPAERAAIIAAENPAVVYFTYGVHGSESSSSEAALWDAWDLASGAESVAGVLDSVIVVIDPNANPDGRERYVNWYRQTLGQKPDPNPDAYEHWEPWPGSRANHYLFDLNRDWAWMTQPETRARLATWSEWTPQVHVDFHEMGYTSSYFFFPATKPINPLYPQHILDWGAYFGEANARAFDERGLHYFTGETFDLFYPAYGDSWPSLVGAIGMTYEQAGGARAGLQIRRPDDSILTLRDRAEGHRTAAAATLRAVATRKGDLLRGFAQQQRSVGLDLSDVLLVPGPDQGRVEALLGLLAGQEIRFEQAGRSFRADARPYEGFTARREFPAGTIRVPARQARGRLASTLLKPEVLLDAEFSYDISAWSLPYAFGVEAHLADAVPDADWVWSDLSEHAAGSFGAAATPGPGSNNRLIDSAAQLGAEPYGYLVAPGFAVWPAIIEFLEQGGNARVMAKGFEMDNRAWPNGTFFLPRLGNPDLVQLVDASGLGDRAVPVWSGRASDGRDLGTGNAYRIERRRIAILTGEGVSSGSFGAHWFFLEQTIGLPFSAVPLRRLGDVDLEEYDVLIVPELSGDWRSSLTSSRFDDLRRWVRRGGTVVAVGGAARAVAEPLAEIETRSRAEHEMDELERALLGREARQRQRWEEQVPGTILSAQLDPDHPLAFGAGLENDPTRLFVLHRGGSIFEPAPEFESPAFFPADLQKISGVIGNRSLDHMSRGTWLADRRLGSGRVILFTDDPLFRHLWYGTFQPYVNALILGPAY